MELAALRGAAGLSQSALAAELGVDQAAVSRVEAGNRRLELAEAFAWLEALGRSATQSGVLLSTLWQEHGARPTGFWEGTNG